MSQALERVRQRAKQDRKVRFTALLHHLSIEALRAAFQRLKVQAAAGADGLSWKTYSAELEDNLRRLHQRLQRGSYRPVPARRVYIPKADGRQRPLGIAALEDKILQSALCEVLNAIYETDFVGFSYGFRPGRNQHQALDAIVVGIRYKKVNWVLDADIRGYFDTIDHEWLQRFLQHRIGDQRVMRLIGKWLKAGVMEEGEWKASEEGTPQGATISPLLANIYLHYVFDLWMEQWRKRHARGEVIVVRYADDFIIGFQDQRDAQRFRVDLKERMEKFALSLNEGKTRLIEFGRYANERRKKRNEGKALTFDFLGFTHICSKASTGKLQILRRTIRKRRNAKLQAISEQLRYRREEPIAEQGAWLHRVLDGYYRYHAVHGNLRVLGAIRTEIAQRWYRSLRRRSHKRKLTWKKMHLHVTRWLPQPKVLHPWPEERFFARHNSR
jgi:group II intron reverse transcriptase/maturase